MELSAEQLVEACGDDSFAAGIRISTELEPLGGPGTTVKPAVYEGGKYQLDRRWRSVNDATPSEVVVIDNVPSQANRLEAALWRHRDEVGLPELQLDFSEIVGLPVHLPRVLSSFQFPHRNADAYLRDSMHDGVDFPGSELGASIFGATPEAAGPLMAWFPQALLYGFWQSHLGKKRQQTKHARAWTSEIIGWSPATTDTRIVGVKGDPLNLTIDEVVTSNPDDRLEWSVGKLAKKDAPADAKADKLSKMGHGQVPFMTESDTAPGGVSCSSVVQLTVGSFAQLRRVSVPGSDAHARALLVALGLFGHVRAFGRGFCLRSGADLIPRRVTVEWLGATGDTEVEPLSIDSTAKVLKDCQALAGEAGVPLDGWGADPIVLQPKANLKKAIRSTWPDVEA